MTLYEKIQALCRKEGFEISNIGEKIPGLSVTRGSITGWKNGAMPRADKIKAIADYFGVPTSYLLGESETACNDDCNTSASETNNLTEHETTLLDIFRKLDTINQARLLTYAADLMK